MYTNVEHWSEIRRWMLVEGVNRRQIIRATGPHWDTLQNILNHSQPPGYRQQPHGPRPVGTLFIIGGGLKRVSRRTEDCHGSNGNPLKKTFTIVDQLYCMHLPGNKLIHIAGHPTQRFGNLRFRFTFASHFGRRAVAAVAASGVVCAIHQRLTIRRVVGKAGRQRLVR